MDEEYVAKKIKPPPAKRSRVSEPIELPDKIRLGTTKKQRHTMLKMLQATTEAKGNYMKRLEQRIYEGTFGRHLHSAYNEYRSELYRTRCFEVLYALRRNAVYYMTRYEPELLASLPPHLMVTETELGSTYDSWKQKQDNDRRMEQEARHTLATEQGEGFMRCPKCGGKFRRYDMQTRSGDEPMTIFLNCQRCGFAKRK